MINREFTFGGVKMNEPSFAPVNNAISKELQYSPAKSALLQPPIYVSALNNPLSVDKP